MQQLFPRASVHRYTLFVSEIIWLTGFSSSHHGGTSPRSNVFVIIKLLHWHPVNLDQDINQFLLNIQQAMDHTPRLFQGI